MLTGNINQFCMTEGTAAPILLEVLAYLKATDFSQIPNGESMYNEHVKIIVTNIDLAPRSTKEAEIHYDTLDLHYTLEGTEPMFYTPFKENCEVLSHDLAKDTAFITSNPSEESCLLLAEGDFVIFYPKECHIPSCSETPNLSIRKVIVKIPSTCL